MSLWSGADLDRVLPPHRGFLEAEEIPPAGKAAGGCGDGWDDLQELLLGLSTKGDKNLLALIWSLPTRSLET